MSGLRMGYEWVTSGLQVGYHWFTNGLRVGYEWVTSGLRVWYKCVTSGLRVGYEWVTSGLLVGDEWATSGLRGVYECVCVCFFASLLLSINSERFSVSRMRNFWIEKQHAGEMSSFLTLA